MSAKEDHDDDASNQIGARKLFVQMHAGSKLAEAHDAYVESRRIGEKTSQGKKMLNLEHSSCFSRSFAPEMRRTRFAAGHLRIYETNAA